ncbi:MAG TPA: Nif3-like dinuclear metal center hexameric protein [Phycisphaerales bacterium]|nr:Nif3-like dinuclear metal center hexameric protein [Phycisphaerales bacterium]
MSTHESPRPLTVADLIAALDSIAPSALAEAWDNVGLILGDPSRPLRSPVLLAIDLTEAVAAEAVTKNCGAVISYHPPIFAPIKRLVADSPRSRALLRLLEAGVVVHSPHTALDAAPGGVTDWLMSVLIGSDTISAPSPSGRGQGEGFGSTPASTPSPSSSLRSFPVLSPHSSLDPAQSLKLVTFVPAKNVDALREALASAGAGRIGEYELCAFATEGTGSFRGSTSSNPTIGKPNQLEFVSEIRLEMVCPARNLPRIIDALKRTHPYEEPAFDVYPLHPRPDTTRGGGRTATLAAPLAITELASRLKRATGSPLVTIATPASPSGATGGSPAPAGTSSPTVRTIACVPGAGASLLDAAHAQGADCFVTGEMRHHDILSATDRGISIILAGHTETERPYLPILAGRLKQSLPTIEFLVSAADRSPLRAV